MPLEFVGNNDQGQSVWVDNDTGNVQLKEPVLSTVEPLRYDAVTNQPIYPPNNNGTSYYMEGIGWFTQDYNSGTVGVPDAWNKLTIDKQYKLWSENPGLANVWSPSFYGYDPVETRNSNLYMAQAEGPLGLAPVLNFVRTIAALATAGLSELGSTLGSILGSTTGNDDAKTALKISGGIVGGAYAQSVDASLLASPVTTVTDGSDIPILTDEAGKAAYEVDSLGQPTGRSFTPSEILNYGQAASVVDEFEQPKDSVFDGDFGPDSDTFLDNLSDRAIASGSNLAAKEVIGEILGHDAPLILSNRSSKAITNGISTIQQKRLLSIPSVFDFEYPRKTKLTAGGGYESIAQEELANTLPYVIIGSIILLIVFLWIRRK